MGIQQQKKWRATHDMRTRHAHRMLDGEIVPYDQPFTAAGAPIMFPGDPDAPPAMVYNCRCTMQTGNDIELEAEPHEMRVRDPVTGRNIVVTEEGFEEWKRKNWGGTLKKVDNPSNDVIIGLTSKVNTPSDKSTVKPTKIISGHSNTPKKAQPNSVIDHVNDEGKVDARAFYGETGMKEKDLHTTNHGYPKKHPYGKNGEHAHDYVWDEKGKLKEKTIREINKEELERNSDIFE